MRRQLLRVLPERPQLAAVEADFFNLLSSWFNPGFIEMQQVDWNSPAQLLDKIIQHEAVHETGAVGEHVRGSAAAARLGKRQVNIGRVESREAHDEIGATDDHETRKGMPQNRERHARSSTFRSSVRGPAPLRSPVGGSEHRPRRLAHEEARSAAHLDDDAPDVLGKNREKRE